MELISLVVDLNTASYGVWKCYKCSTGSWAEPEPMHFSRSECYWWLLITKIQTLHFNTFSDVVSKINQAQCRASSTRDRFGEDGQLEASFYEKKVSDRPIEIDLKKRIVKCISCSITLYGAETWTMTKADIQRG